MIISILNQKGGVGKTTLSINLHRELILSGRETILVDTDPQGTARDYNAMGNGEFFNVIGLDRASLHKDIKTVQKKYDWIILDGAPRLEEMAVAAIKCSDIVLIPVQPSPLDIWGTSDLVELIKARRELTNGSPKTAFIISRRLVNTTIGKQASEVLEGFDLPVFKSCTCNRVIYAKCAEKGESVIDASPHGEAANEIRRIIQELEEFAK